MSQNPSATIPKISVTSYHATNSKYNNILEDTISHLQNIRESIQNVVPAATTAASAANASAHRSALLLGDAAPMCLSLPDLTQSTAAAAGGESFATLTVGGLTPGAKKSAFAADIFGWYNGGRRKSWAAVEERHGFDRMLNKSDSISSLESQSRTESSTNRSHQPQQQHALSMVHKRRSNSTIGSTTAATAPADGNNGGSSNTTGGGGGGVANNSTHSLNDAKFFMEFERQHEKIELSMMHCRLPLQKSISTPSIPPVSDTDEENQDERSRLCVKEKTSEVDNPEKRRKRGSLFFRKKKDKSKAKATTPKHCDECSNASGSCAEHTYEVHAKGSLKHIQIAKSSSKKGSDNSHSRLSGGSMGDPFKDLADGTLAHHHGDQTIVADDAALLQYEFLNEPHLLAHHLDDDPVLGIGRETEHDTWSPRVGDEVRKQLTAKEIKRQEHIYELIITEKRHCQILCLMQKVFVDSLKQHFDTLNIDRLFPRLLDLSRLHKAFLKQLRLKQDTHPVVDSIADILLEFFGGAAAQHLKSAYGEFCANHQAAVDLFKFFQNKDVRFATWHKHKQTNPLLKRKGIPECTLFVVQRLTKYPILIEDQLKLTKDDEQERAKLLRANALIKDILVDVNAQVAQKENHDRHMDIFKRIDAKSATTYRDEKFKKSDIMCFGRKLKFEGLATLMQGRSKPQTVNVIVLSDCLFFLQESSAKFQFFTPETKAGVVSLQKLIVRKNATHASNIYLLSPLPEMYELQVQHPKDRHTWITAIDAAVLAHERSGCGAPPGIACDANGAPLSDAQQLEQQQAERRETARRELIERMRLNDLEHAVLLEQKITAQVNYLREMGVVPVAPMEGASVAGAETYLAQFASYRHLLGRDEASVQCDAVDLTRRAVNTVQEIGTLTATLYRTATGVELPLRVASLTAHEMTPAGGRKGERGGGGGGLSGGNQHHGGGVGGGLGGGEHTPYKHPSRAETFSGFDEKMSKLISPWRDAVVSSLTNSIIANTSAGNSAGNLSSTTAATQNDSATSSSTSSPNVNASSRSGSHHDSPRSTHNQQQSTGGQTPAASVGSGSPNHGAASSSGATSSTSSLDTVTLSHVTNSGRARVAATAHDHHNALLVAHHLYGLLAVVHQQMSTIAALQHELRDHPKALYRPDVQLEELRNLQDKFQAEKTEWLRQRDAQETELAAKQAELRAQQQRMHDEQEDIREQREQLFRKMEKMERLAAAAAAATAVTAATPTTGAAAATGLPIGTEQMLGNTAGVPEMSVDGVGTSQHVPLLLHQGGSFHQQQQQQQQPLGPQQLQQIDATFSGAGISRRSSTKERMSSHSKSGHQQNFNNVPKANNTVKQTLPLKLSNSKSDKSNKNPFSPTASNAGGGITQILPLKLADRKSNQSASASTTSTSSLFSPTSSSSSSSFIGNIGGSSTPLTSNHTRTGSSPAVVQPNVTSPTSSHAAAGSRYDDRSRASRRSDTALLPSSMTATMNTRHLASAIVPSAGGRMLQQQQQPTQQQLQQQYKQQLLYQQQQQQQPRPLSANAAIAANNRTVAGSGAANENPQHMNSQQEEIYL